MDGLKKRDLLVCLLHFGYGVNDDKESTVLVVNIKDDVKFFSNIALLISHFALEQPIKLNVVENQQSPRSIEDMNSIKRLLHLKTCKDYSRGARYAIYAIYNSVCSAIRNDGIEW